VSAHACVAEACIRAHRRDDAIARARPIEECSTCHSARQRTKGNVVTLIWIVIGILLVVVWVFSVVDIFRRHYSAGTTIAWLALIVILPFVGSVIYWAVRKPTRDETEQAFLAQAELRRNAGTGPIDRTGMGG
jgi:uncharacterized membrane protein